MPQRLFSLCHRVVLMPSSKGLVLDFFIRAAEEVVSITTNRSLSSLSISVGFVGPSQMGANRLPVLKVREFTKFPSMRNNIGKVSAFSSKTIISTLPSKHVALALWSHEPGLLNGRLENCKVGGCKETRQPFPNPSPTLCQSFANPLPTFAANPSESVSFRGPQSRV